MTVIHLQAPGRTENCQIGVFAAYASSAGRALVDRELYLPKSWTDDRERCRAAKVPDEREFATKNTLAATIVRRALSLPLPIAWVTADAAYGQDNRFRRMLETSGVGYVLAVPKSQFSLAGPRIDTVFEQAPDQAWERRSCGAGAKGQREYDWAAVQLRPVAEYDHQDGVLIRRRWALARRSVNRPDELPRLRAAGCRRGRAGAGGRAPVGDRGVFPGGEERVRPGPVRGAPLCRLVPAHHARDACARLPRGDDRAGGRKGGCTGEEAEIIELTVAEVRRLLAACAPRRPRARTHALSWSRWRRRRQAVARHCHYRRRGHSFEGRVGRNRP